MPRDVETLLARRPGKFDRRVYVSGSHGYALTGDESPEERIALHDWAVASADAELATREHDAAAVRQALAPPGRAYLDAAFLRLHERLDNIEHALAGASGPGG